MRSISSLERRPLSLVMVILLACRWPFHGGDVQDSVGVKVEGDLDLGNTTGGRGNASELELAEQVVVLGAMHARPRTPGSAHRAGCRRRWRRSADFLVGMVVLRLIRAVMTPPAVSMPRDSGVTSSSRISLVTCAVVTREDGGLDGSTVGDSLIGVDGLVGLLAVEEVRNELLHLGDTGGATDQDDLVDGALSILASRRTCSTGSMVPRKRSWQSSSKRARVMEV